MPDTLSMFIPSLSFSSSCLQLADIQKANINAIKNALKHPTADTLKIMDDIEAKYSGEPLFVIFLWVCYLSIFAVSDCSWICFYILFLIPF